MSAITFLYRHPITPTRTTSAPHVPARAFAALPISPGIAAVVRAIHGAAAVSGLSVCARCVAAPPFPATRPLTLSPLTAEQRINTRHQPGAPAYRPFKPVRLSGPFPSITLNPRPGSLPGINDKGPEHMQVESRAQELADNTKAMKRSLIRIFSRDGEIDEEEMEVIRDFNEHQKDLEAKAQDEVFGVAMIRRGRDSDRVIRLGRQMFHPDPNAA